MWFDTDAELFGKSCVSGYPDGSGREAWAPAGLGVGSTDLSLRVFLDTDHHSLHNSRRRGELVLCSMGQEPAAAWVWFCWENGKGEK